MGEATHRARTALPVARVQRGTMQEDVYQQAKQLILNGELAPGQSITIQWLADAFGVSAMPVREAILRLTAEKALTVVAGRSLGIPLLSRGRLDDLTRTRLEIEALAVAWAVPNMARDVLARLNRLIDEMDNIKPGSAIELWLSCADGFWPTLPSLNLGFPWLCRGAQSGLECQGGFV